MPDKYLPCDCYTSIQSAIDLYHGKCLGHFTSLKTYNIRLTGRIKHFHNSFGEHMMVDEVEPVLQISDSLSGISKSPGGAE